MNKIPVFQFSVVEWYAEYTNRHRSKPLNIMFDSSVVFNAKKARREWDEIMLLEKEFKK